MARLIPLDAPEERVYRLVQRLCDHDRGVWLASVVLGGMMVRLLQVLHSGNPRMRARVTADLDVAVLPLHAEESRTLAALLQSIGLRSVPGEPFRLVELSEEGEILSEVNLLAAEPQPSSIRAQPPREDVGGGVRTVVTPGARLALRESRVERFEVEVPGESFEIDVRLPSLEAAIVSKACNLILDRNKLIQDVTDLETLLLMLGANVGELLRLLTHETEGRWAADVLDRSFGTHSDLMSRLRREGYDSPGFVPRVRALLRRL